MKKNDVLLTISRSWQIADSPLTPTADILNWIRQRNETVAVNIRKIALEECAPWYWDEDEGCIRNTAGSFFRISGFEQKLADGSYISQPILLQQEIGYLGILCKEFDGVMHFLMQAKIEPGNVNKIQLSPTIQATKSNFTQKHGGAKPAYLDYFVNAAQHEIVVDQIQSEQSSRFYKKRNRNIIICVKDEVEVLATHRWMTLGQIKRLMREENLVNMDTRTVLSCIPYNEGESICHGVGAKPYILRIYLKGDSRKEISVNNEYLRRGKLKVQLFGRGMAWLDTGTYENLLEAARFVEIIQKRQGLHVSCIEEIAYRKGFISREQLLELAQPLMKTEYGRYLQAVAEEEL